MSESKPSSPARVWEVLRASTGKALMRETKERIWRAISAVSTEGEGESEVEGEIEGECEGEVEFEDEGEGEVSASRIS